VQGAWRVDVVLRADGSGDDAAALVVAFLGEGAERAWSWDMDPPGGSIGVGIRVDAGSVGEAAETGLRLVTEACRAVTGRDLELWDLRVIPQSTIEVSPPERRPTSLLRRFRRT
jgi:hypothetical protein